MLTHLVCGSDHVLLPVAPVRSEAQRAAVEQITLEPDFDNALNNPFVPEIGDYTGPFRFMWWTTDGTLHVRRIGKRGNTLGESSHHA